MSEYFVLYVATIVDQAISSLDGLKKVLLIIISILVIIATVLAASVEESWDNVQYILKNIYFKWLIGVLIFLQLFVPLIPSSKSLAVIFIVPKILHSNFVQKRFS